MTIVKEDSFRSKAKELGLKRVNLKYWFLPGCDLMFSYNSEWGCIDACGVVPMDLSIELYNYFKNVESQTIANAENFQLKDPLLEPCDVVKHESIIDLASLTLEAETCGKKWYEVYEDKLGKALKEDYDNCYTDSYYICSLLAFIKFVEVVQAYYSRKKEQDKSFTYQLQG